MLGKANYAYGIYSSNTTDLGENFAKTYYPEGGTKPRIIVFEFRRIRAPDKFVMIADTATTKTWFGAPTSDHRPFARFYRTGSGGYTERLHLQHYGHANTLFFDGHVKGQSQTDLANGPMMMRAFYSLDFQPITL